MLSKRYGMLLTLILFLVTVRLYADGCFVWKKGADLTEPSQKAIIYFKDGSEVLVLQVKYEGPAEDFAWIVPLPAKPKVAAIDADKSPFAEISFYTQLRRRWGYKGRVPAKEETVTVLERKIVGVYDVAVLAASEAGALSNWLNNNGYAFPKERKDVLEHYTKKKWVYVAMRIDRKALENDEVKKLKTGELQPIRFIFSAKEMVYPLKISSVNAGETEVLLYLLADVPMVAKGEHKRPGLSIESNISRFPRYHDPAYGTYRRAKGEELPLTWEALGLQKDKEFSLCKYRSVYKVEEMTNDLVFARFEPVPYWRKRLRESLEGDYWWLKPCAISVLAYHDANLFRDLAGEQDKRMREFIASYPATPKQVLLELAHDEEVSVRLELLRNANISVGLLGELAKDKEKKVRGAVLSHPKTSVDTFRKLAEDKSRDIRRFIASSNRTPVDVLCKLAGDNIAEVRERVVDNPNTPKQLLEELARDRSHLVRGAVAKNKRIPVSILCKLAGDSSPYTRRHVASNSNTPKDLLEELARDGNYDVRAMVAHNINTPVSTLRKLSRDISPDVRRSLIYNLSTPEELLYELAADQDWELRRILAEHRNTTVKILRKLANDRHALVRLAVAANSNTPADVLQILAEDKNPDVSEFAGAALKKRGL